MFHFLVDFFLFFQNTTGNHVTNPIYKLKNTLYILDTTFECDGLHSCVGVNVAENEKIRNATGIFQGFSFP